MSLWKQLPFWERVLVVVLGGGALILLLVS